MKSDKETIESMLATRRYSMFFPGSRNDLLLEYPDLRSIPSIKKVGDKPKELLFVWYYACKASPAMALVDDRSRIEFALKAVWGDPVPADVHSRFINHKWGETVSMAIDDMRKFELGPRVMSKLIVERTIRNIAKLLDVDADSIASNDWDTKKAYMDVAVKGTQALMGLQAKADGDFGVREVGEADLRPGETMMALHQKQLIDL